MATKSRGISAAPAFANRGDQAGRGARCPGLTGWGRFARAGDGMRDGVRGAGGEYGVGTIPGFALGV